MPPILPPRLWEELFGDPHRKLVVQPYFPPAPGYSDACHGEDSGFTTVADSDASTSADSALVAFSSADASTSSDAVYSAWPSDTDHSSGNDFGWQSGPFGHSDTSGPEVDGGEVVTVQSSDASGLTVDSGPVIDVYSFQPPFRWTGGGFELVVPHPHLDVAEALVLWRGDRVDGSALRLYAAFEAGLVHFVSANDAAGSGEGEEVASLAVALHVAPAHVVRLEVS